MQIWPLVNLLSTISLGIILVWLNANSKRKEIKFQLYHTKKLVALENFMTAFTEMQKVWRDFEILYHAGFELHNQEMKRQQPIKDNFASTFLILRIYLNQNELRSFQAIFDAFDAVHDYLIANYVQFAQTGQGFPDVFREFNNFRSLAINGSLDRFTEIGNMIREEYQIREL